MKPAVDSALGNNPTVDYAARATRSGQSLLLRYVATGAMSFVGTSLLLRLAGPSRWAPYTVAYFLVTFSDRELGNRLLGALVRSTDEPSSELVETGARIMVFLGLGMLIALSVLGTEADQLSGIHGLGLCLLGAAASIMILALRAVPLVRMERELLYGWIAVVEVLDQATFFAVAIPLTAVDPSVRWLALSLAVRVIPSTVLVRYRARSPLFGRLHRSQARRILHYALPGGGTAVLIVIEGLVPLMVLSNSHQLAFAMTAASVISYPGLVLTVVHRLSFPAFSRIASDAERLAGLIDRTTQLSLFAMATLIVPAGAAAPLWVPLLLGHAWSGAAAPIALIGIGNVAAAALSIAGGGLNTLARPASLFRVYAVAEVVYLVVAVSAHGSAGVVALGFCISRFTGLALATGSLRRQACAVQLWRPLGIAALTGLATMLGFWLNRDHEWAAAIVVAGCASAVWIMWLRRELPSVRAVLRRTAGPRGSLLPEESIAIT